MKKELKAKLNFIFISIYLIKVILFISSDLINLSERAKDEQSALHDLLDTCNTLVVEKNENGEYIKKALKPPYLEKKDENRELST